MKKMCVHMCGGGGGSELAWEINPNITEEKGDIHKAAIFRKIQFSNFFSHHVSAKMSKNAFLLSYLNKLLKIFCDRNFIYELKINQIRHKMYCAVFA